jgi:hypothetical protein
MESLWIWRVQNLKGLKSKAFQDALLRIFLPLINC